MAKLVIQLNEARFMACRMPDSSSYQMPSYLMAKVISSGLRWPPFGSSEVWQFPARASGVDLKTGNEALHKSLEGPSTPVARTP